MKIEFRKVPHNPKEIVAEFDSVKIEGTFCKISQSLVKINAVLKGKTDIDCCRCGVTDIIEVDEQLDILLSDGIYKNNERDEIIIEIENSLIDFDELIQSELDSIRSDYYICEECSKMGDDFEKEF